MYTLKSVARRGTLLTAAFTLAAATLLPATFASADALNPLTHRSLTLSSSSPGWSYTDGSGNSTYAAPNSGANGKQTGNTFQFNTSSDTTSTAPDHIQAMSFQYCTASAGQCQAPGNDASNTADPGHDGASWSDLNVNFPTPAEVSQANFSTVVNTTTGAIQAVPGDADGAAAAIPGNFVVYYDNAGTWTQSSGWTLSAGNQEEASTTTGKNNWMVLSNSTTPLEIPANTTVKVVFFGTTNDYITNPGAGAFFVKINTYKAFTDGSPATVASSDVIDGGVTVANVMNQSIEIQTKVLETMQFSVGTVDPNTLTSDGTLTSAYAKATGDKNHAPCDTIATRLDNTEGSTEPVNTLKLGNESAENTLSTTSTYSTHSYWRLSSNSSAGATVYYSGVTLSNTVGDQIDAIGKDAKEPHLGTEQFGLALDNGDGSDVNTTTKVGYAVNYSQERNGTNDTEDAVDNGLTSLDPTTLSDNATNGSWHLPQLYPLTPAANYGGGTGVVDSSYGTPNTSFAFDTTSNTIPVPVASESSQVVDCVTGKMRYIADMAATTPAGIYTTKVNYIAAPQY